MDKETKEALEELIKMDREGKYINDHRHRWTDKEVLEIYYYLNSNLI